MPNKTIYVRNEELWNKAKAIAGKEGEGLSGVIAEALAAFVQKHEAAADGQVVHRLTVQLLDSEGELERVAFAGRQIDSHSFPLWDGYMDPDGSDTLVATVYATKGGKFVLTLSQDGDTFHYAIYSRPDGIGQDEELLRRVKDRDDIRRWAKSVHLQHFEKTATETWIE